MATTGVGFRWLDILEKEFDKACVELDTSLTELDADEPDVVYGARQRIATLSSCFSQLTHKALTIFQNSAKLEAELVDMRAELVQARAACVGGLQDSGDVAGNVPEAARARAEAAQLARENAALRDTVLALHSDLFGARLATKYLDKELAGRIQQLQLLGREMRAELRDSLWAQVEAEILVQRHKTLVRVCRGLSPGGGGGGGAGGAGAARPARDSRPRTVRVRRSPHLGLGISVTGGREHGVPILISELEAGGPAANTGQLYVGDAILAINDVDLTQASHADAVAALQRVKGDCALRVHYVAADDDDRLSDDTYRFPLYPEEDAFGGGATPTAPRTPDYHSGGGESDAGSGSECSPAAPYPDYNNINNNLSILDMDDFNIKIETRLEPAACVVEAARAAGAAASALVSTGTGSSRRGPYRALAGASSGDSQSTPVHARRVAPKKKRKPHDWRSKGAYRAVEAREPPSSDDPLPNRQESPSPSEEASDTAVAVNNTPAPAPVAATAPVSAGPNGDAKRREGKGFRIGSARRVTEPAPPPATPAPPAPPTASAPAPAPLTNGVGPPERRQPTLLLAGDGDPDFGTPV